MNIKKRVRTAVDGRSSAVAGRGRRVALLVAAFAAAGLAVTGCSADEPGGGASPAPGAGGAGGADSTKAVQYAQCMRSNGLKSFPDPVNGRFQLRMTRGTEMDPNNPTFQAARNACKSLEPPGVLGGQAQSSAQQAQMLKFSACMRKNGVPKFPDPQNGGLTMGGEIDPNSPQFKSAMQKCRKLLPGGTAIGGR
jgi:hypothetical protein